MSITEMKNHMRIGEKQYGSYSVLATQFGISYKLIKAQLYHFLYVSVRKKKTRQVGNVVLFY